jgi:hypothetical protein
VFRQCGSCGATVELDPEVVGVAGDVLSTTCAYCRSELVDTDQGTVAIDLVAPFRIPRPAAQQRLLTHLADRWWVAPSLRKAARSGQMRAESLRGVLVPFYAYTASVHATYRARIGIHWYREETQKTDDENTKTTRVQETEWFDLRGSAVDQLENHLVEASVGLTEAEAKRLLPFDLGHAKPFDPRLLAGWLAELPSRSLKEVDRSARQRIWELEQTRLVRTLLPGDKRRVGHFECDIDIHGVKLALLPVWVASVRHGDRVYRLLVHGQTGRCFGEAPLAIGRIVLTAVALALAVGLAIWLWGEWPRWR